MRFLESLIPLGAIADAFLDTDIIFHSEDGSNIIKGKTVFATGKVTDSWGNPLPFQWDEPRPKWEIFPLARYGKDFDKSYCSTIII